MEFKQLQSFVAVVDYGSFTKAAKKLFISQPTISTHIRLLEEEFESILLDRTTKSISLTPRGKEFYQCASSILALQNQLIKNWVDESRKTVYLGASTIPSAYILPEVLPDYQKQHPDVFFNIHQSDSQGIINGLLNGNFHVGLIGMNCTDESISCTPFFTDHMVMITPKTPHYLAYQKHGASPTEIILQEPMILREHGSGSRKSAENLMEHLQIDEDRLFVTARLNDQESIKNMVAGGLGVSIISEKAARGTGDENRLLIFDLPEYTATRSLYVAYHKNFILKPHTLQFIEFLTDYYKISQ